MLVHVQETEKKQKNCFVLPIKDASFPTFFYDGLQYSPPARGTWNIVHTNMLVPGSHQIYICALGCLRGVVLTAAEMGALSRFSSIVIEEKQLFDGTMEDVIIRGIGEILARLPSMPTACFLYPSCVHHFMGCDLRGIYKQLTTLYKETKFVLCWMDPIRRNSKLTAEMRTRRQIYSLIEPQPKDLLAINIIGSNLPIMNTCQLYELLQQNGYHVYQLPTCKTYDEYQKMGSSILNIGQEPLAHVALDALEQRLGQAQLYISNAWNYEEIEQHLQQVAMQLHIPCPAYEQEKKQCDAALLGALQVVQDRPIAIDFTAVSRPFSLARLLLTHGFLVDRIYCDVASADEAADVSFLQMHYPHVMIYSVRHVNMKGQVEKGQSEYVAIGQKAAYYTGTSHFVNIVEGGGLRDFAGIIELAKKLAKAVRQEQRAEEVIQHKGWGCTLCQ